MPIRSLDSNDDGDFDSSDLVFVFQQGNYVGAARAANLLGEIAASLDDAQEELETLTVATIESRQSREKSSPLQEDEFADRDSIFDSFEDDSLQHKPSELDDDLLDLLSAG